MATEYFDVLVEENQNLRDVCLQVYGSLDYLLKFARENGLGDGVNENIRPGQKLVYEKLSPLKDFDAASVQQIYKDREIRVVTGEVNTRPTDNCNIPEGYTKLSIRWVGVPKFLVAFLTKDACPVRDVAEIETYAFWKKMVSNTSSAAYLFAQWVNEYYGAQGFVATNENEQVDILIPKSYADCGTEFFICFYWMTRKTGFGEQPSTGSIPADTVEMVQPRSDSVLFANSSGNGGYTQCCSTLTSIDETYNQSTK